MKLSALVLVSAFTLLSGNAPGMAAVFQVTGTIPTDGGMALHVCPVNDDHSPESEHVFPSQTSKGEEGETQLSLDQLKQQLLAKEKELFMLREEKAATNGLLNAERDHRGALEAQLTRKEQKVGALRDRGDSQGQVSQELIAMRNSLQQAKQQIEDLERQLAISNLGHALRRIDQLEHRLDSKDKEIASLQSTVDEGFKLKADLAVQREELARANHRAGELEQQLAGKDQELTQVKADLKQVTHKLEELDQHLTARNAELAQAKQLLADLGRNVPKQGEAVHSPKPGSGDNNTLVGLPPDPGLTVISLSLDDAIRENNAEASRSDLIKVSETPASTLGNEI